MASRPATKAVAGPTRPTPSSATTVTETESLKKQLQESQARGEELGAQEKELKVREQELKASMDELIRRHEDAINEKTKTAEEQEAELLARIEKAVRHEEDIVGRITTDHDAAMATLGREAAEAVDTEKAASLRRAEELARDHSTLVSRLTSEHDALVTRISREQEEQASAMKLRLDAAESQAQGASLKNDELLLVHQEAIKSLEQGHSQMLAALRMRIGELEQSEAELNGKQSVLVESHGEVVAKVQARLAQVEQAEADSTHKLSLAVATHEKQTQEMESQHKRATNGLTQKLQEAQEETVKTVIFLEETNKRLEQQLATEKRARIKVQDRVEELEGTLVRDAAGRARDASRAGSRSDHSARSPRAHSSSSSPVIAAAALNDSSSPSTSDAAVPGLSGELEDESEPAFKPEQDGESKQEPKMEPERKIQNEQEAHAQEHGPKDDPTLKKATPADPLPSSPPSAPSFSEEKEEEEEGDEQEKPAEPAPKAKQEDAVPSVALAQGAPPLATHKTEEEKQGLQGTVHSFE